MTQKKVKGIGLLSGGLDSILAVKVLQDQDLDLIGVMFVTPFFGPRPGVDLSRMTGVEVVLIDISERHLEMLKKPAYGYGSQMNPCIDCHALMLNEAGRMMEREGAEFLFTGEVLGQRPMSQRRDSMRSVEKLSGYAGRVLRPLSAKLLAPTIPEVEGRVDRGRLLDIQGRSRKRQMALAEHYGITDYPQPGGGCMLTKEGFGNRLRELLSAFPGATPRLVEFLKWGRHFKLPEGTLCIIGRDQKDNKNLEALADGEEIVLHTLDYPGPTAIVLPSPEIGKSLETVAMMLASYSDAAAVESVRVEWRRGGESQVLSVPRVEKARFAGYLI